MQHLIGRTVKVLPAGLCGVVEDETRNSLIVRTDRGPKRVLKALCRLEIDGAEFNGAQFIGRYEDRIKKGQP